MADTSDASDRSPPPETLREIREQYTPELHHVLLRFAQQRARMVRQAGRPCPPPQHYGAELLHDARVDTWVGIRWWEPPRCSLGYHLRRAIQSRSWAEIKQGPRFRSLDLYVANDDGDDDNGGGRPDPDAEQITEGLIASSGSLGLFVFPALVARVCNALRPAAKDHATIALVRAWERGFCEKEEILEITDLTEDDYRRARDRLFYASRDLPPDLRQLVQDLLRSAS